MFYAFFISLLFNLLNACEIVETLYVEDSVLQRKMTGKQVQAYNTATLTEISSFLENRDQTTLTTLIESATLEDRDQAIATAAIINLAILENRDQVTLATLIQFLAERDSSTTYQVALGKLINLAILKNKDSSTPVKLINFSTLDDGDQITLEVLTGKHLVWCDIHMARTHGNIALENLIKKAQKEKFRLPPFIAVTTENLYYQRSYAEKRGFILGRDKIKTQAHIKSVLQFCETTLGANWIEIHTGMPLPVPSSPRIPLSIKSEKRNSYGLSSSKVIPIDTQDSTGLDIPVAVAVKKTVPVQKAEATPIQGNEVVDFIAPAQSPREGQISSSSKHFKSPRAATVNDKNLSETTYDETFFAQQDANPLTQSPRLVTNDNTSAGNQLSSTQAQLPKEQSSVQDYFDQFCEYMAKLGSCLARLA